MVISDIFYSAERDKIYFIKSIFGPYILHLLRVTSNPLSDHAHLSPHPSRISLVPPVAPKYENKVSQKFFNFWRYSHFSIFMQVSPVFGLFLHIYAGLRYATSRWHVMRYPTPETRRYFFTSQQLTNFVSGIPNVFFQCRITSKFISPLCLLGGMNRCLHGVLRKGRVRRHWNCVGQCRSMFHLQAV